MPFSAYLGLSYRLRKLIFDNSPFGAWVVCVYRTKASLEPQGGKCNDSRLFLFSKKWVSIKTDDETVDIPLNNWGEIDGVVKYWNSNIGNVEITVNASMPRGFDEKGKSKVVKVNIKGCTFTPPRKIISYKNTKFGKIPVYEKFTPKCEAVATETGMSILLDSIKSYRFRESEFVPKFLMIFLDWNKVD